MAGKIHCEMWKRCDQLLNLGHSYSDWFKCDKRRGETGLVREKGCEQLVAGAGQGQSERADKVNM